MRNKNLNKLLLVLGLCTFATTIASPKVSAVYTKAQVEAMMTGKGKTADLTGLEYAGAEDVEPTVLDNNLNTQTLVDKNNKVIFINQLSNSKNKKLFENELLFMQQKKMNISNLSSSEYNLKKNELDQLAKNIDECSYNQSSSCINQNMNLAKDLTSDKESWNKQIILVSQIILGLNVVTWLIYFFGTKKETVVVKDEH